MTQIKKDPRVYTRPIALISEPEKEKPVAKETAPKAAPDRKAPGPKRRKT